MRSGQPLNRGQEISLHIAIMHLFPLRRGKKYLSLVEKLHCYKWRCGSFCPWEVIIEITCQTFYSTLSLLFLSPLPFLSPPPPSPPPLSPLPFPSLPLPPLPSPSLPSPLSPSSPPLPLNSLPSPFPPPLSRSPPLPSPPLSFLPCSFSSA